MKQISELIDEWAESEYGEYRHMFFGFCDLIKQNDQPIPMTVPGRKKASLDNNFDLITWMRLDTNIESAIDENNSYGKKQAIRQTADLRYIIASRASLGEEFIIQFNNSIPDKLTHADYKYIFINEARVVNADHETIYDTELGKTEYDKHRIDWNLYAILLKIELLYCK